MPPSNWEIEAAAKGIRDYVAAIEVGSDGDITPDPMADSMMLARAALMGLEQAKMKWLENNNYAVCHAEIEAAASAICELDGARCQCVCAPETRGNIGRCQGPFEQAKAALEAAEQVRNDAVLREILGLDARVK